MVINSRASSSGRIAKAKRYGKTKSQLQDDHFKDKNHRWESFSSKIAKLHTLDPLRQVRRHDLADDENDESATTSYLRNGLEKWEDDTTAEFAAFRRKVVPLSESLAQILYYEQQIMDALCASIAEVQARNDERLALEPLLDILTAFAHDLGTRFVSRGFHTRSFHLIVDVVCHNTGAGQARQGQQNHILDANVIEWTFAALAFLFKYLSRFLIPDLRPTYDILAPILGRPNILPNVPASTTATTKIPVASAAKTLKRLPPHIARFSAEALSFLIGRVASSPTHRDSSLPKIIKHARNDLLRAQTDVIAADALPKYKNHIQLYTQGLMTMFAEAMKGPRDSLSLNCSTIYLALLGAIPDSEFDVSHDSADEQVEGYKTTWSDLCCGVLTSMLHHTSRSTMQPLAAEILARASERAVAVKEREQKKAWQLSIHVRLIGTLAGVRHGSKIQDWELLCKTLTDVLEAMVSGGEYWPTNPASVWQHVVVNVAIVWSQAPFNIILGRLKTTTNLMDREPLEHWYIPFCAYLSHLNAEVFREMFRPHFQRFIANHWSKDSNEDLLCVVLTDMVSNGVLPPPSAGFDSTTGNGPLKLPQSWQDQIVSKFEKLENTPFPEPGGHGKDPETWNDRCLPKYGALLNILDVTSIHPSTSARISELLLRKLKLALRPTAPHLAGNVETTFIVSQGFRAYMRMTKALGATPDPGLRLLLRAAAPQFSRRTVFLQTLLDYEHELAKVQINDHKEEESGRDSDEEEQEENPFLKALVTNLYASSHDLRLVSLELLELIESKELLKNSSHASALTTMLQAEGLPAHPDNIRNIAVHLRQLALTYPHVEEGSWIQRAIPAFLFGRLYVPLSPVWSDSIQAMLQISRSGKIGEEAIAQLAFEWLEVPAVRDEKTGPPSWTMTKGKQIRTDFECTNYDRLNALAEKTHHVMEEPTTLLSQTFHDGQEAVPIHAGREREKALKVLGALPSIAEKRSRKLVPHLLSWTEDQGVTRAEGSGTEGDEEMEDVDDSQDEDEDDGADGNDVASNNADDLGGGWTFPEKKALIVVFSQFTNSRVLYQADKAYDALLKLMANGDIEIQRLALKSLLAWRQDELLRFKDNLEQLLDEAKFKNELTLFLQNEENPIMPAHKPVLMPVLLRLLYGRAISKKGAASGRQGLQATRQFVIRNLDVDGIGGFLEIALGNLRNVRVLDDTKSALRESVFVAPSGHEDTALITARKQVGLLNVLESIINELGANATPYLDLLVNGTLYCLISACRGLRAAAAGDEAEEEEDDDKVDFEDATRNTSLLRVAKTTALRCLCALFRNTASVDWTPYRDVIVAEVISPVLDTLPQDSTQGASWTWNLMETWSLMPKCALFLAADDRILPQILAVLSIDRAKDAIKIFALSIIDNLVKLVEAPATASEFNELILSELLTPNLDTALQNIHHVLRSTVVTTIPAANGSENKTITSSSEISHRLLEACVGTVVSVSPHVRESTHVRNLVDIATWLLNQPSRRVNPRIKGELLLILEKFISLDSNLGSDGKEDAKELQTKVFNTISSLFSFFKDRENRQSLCRVLSVFAAAQESPEDQDDLQTVADICFDLNSYIEGSIEEPDFQRRLAAYRKIARPSTDETKFTLDQWLPLLHNMVFYIRDDQEFAVLASNAADSFCKFIDDATDLSTHQPSSDAYTELLDTIIMPSVFSGVRDPSQAVRQEVVRVFGFLIAHLSRWGPVADLAPLVVEAGSDATEADTQMEDINMTGDDRDNKAFFVSILGTTLSKQIQAMQVLEGANARYAFSSRNVSRFFIPLLEQFVLGRTDGSDDHGLGAQATNTIAQLAYSLEWNQYRALLRRFLGFIETRPELQKQVVRLLDKVVCVLAVSGERKQEAKKEEGGDSAQLTRLASSIPDTEKLTDEVLNTLTPALIKHLHEKDEATVSARVPVGIIVVQLLNLLPPEIRDQRLAGVLTDICHILRSKSWEAREMARDTLVRIASILGSSAFGFMVKELRGALTRGYQLHVLSYTLHSLLLEVIPQFEQGDLDYCLEPMMEVIMDDIFGVVGQEKDADEYTSKMKEVKSSKSMDSAKLLARTASVNQLTVLVQPLKNLFLERIDLKIARKMDKILEAIAAGLVKNSAAESQDTLVFCYEVILGVYESQEADAAGEQAKKKIDPRTKKFLYQKSERNNVGKRVAGKFTYKLIAFALNVLKTVLRKFDSLRMAKNIAGLIPLLRQVVLDSHEEEVKIAAFQLLTALAKVPFPEGDAAATKTRWQWSNLYISATKVAAQSVQDSSSTKGELAQAAIKLLSVVVRDRGDDVPLANGAAVADMVLGKLKDDLTEPQYRTVAFRFVRSVLDRHIETAAVYDALDHIRSVMVTNDDDETRKLARSALLQFLREYPQTRKRWTDQCYYLYKNLDYERESGRMSVLEAIANLILKTPAGAPAISKEALKAGVTLLQQEIAGNYFEKVLLMAANEKSAACRDGAKVVLRIILQKAGPIYTAKALTNFRGLLEQDVATTSKRVKLGFQTFEMYFSTRKGIESTDSDEPEDASLVEMSTSDIRDAEALLARATAALSMEEVRTKKKYGSLAHAALACVKTLLPKTPTLVLDAQQEELWQRVEQCLWHVSSEVRLLAMELIKLYLDHFQTKGKTHDDDVVAVGPHGLKLRNEDISRLVRGCLSVLSTGAGLKVDAAEAEAASNLLISLGPHLKPESEEEAKTDKKGVEKVEEEEEEEEDSEEEEEQVDGEQGEDEEDEGKPVVSEEADAQHTSHEVIDRRYVYLRLARIVRRETPPRAEALVPKIAAMAVLEVYCRDKAFALSLVSTRAVLRPLRNLTDSSIAAPSVVDPLFTSRFDELKQRAQSLMDTLQTRLGNAVYTQQLLAVGAATRGRRQHRATKRKIEAVAQPEKYGEDKRRKLVKQKERRKARGAEHRERRKGY